MLTRKLNKIKPFTLNVSRGPCEPGKGTQVKDCAVAERANRSLAGKAKLRGSWEEELREGVW